MVIIREYEDKDIDEMIEIWNDIVNEGNTFPQENTLTKEQATKFFSEQSYTGVAEDTGKIVGLYILHPNNVGRCAHIANASYAVKNNLRGKKFGEQLVKHSLKVAKDLNFKILQFNAVVATNASAIHLYKKLGFKKLGVIPNGFKINTNTYLDIILFYIEL